MIKLRKKSLKKVICDPENCSNQVMMSILCDLKEVDNEFGFKLILIHNEHSQQAVFGFTDGCDGVQEIRHGDQEETKRIVAAKNTGKPQGCS